MTLNSFSDHDPNDIELARYLSNESTAEQRQSIERWLDGDRSRQTMIKRIAQLWNQPASDEEHWDEARMLSDLLKRRDIEKKIKVWREQPSPSE